MTSVVTFAPIAVQLARSVSLDELFPRSAVEEMLREQRERAPESTEAKLSSDVEPFFAHYCVVTRAAARLLGAPAFERLARLHEQLEEEYMPGGPPMSPVYDSFAMQFVLGAVPQGIGNETPYSVLARLLLRDPSRARLQCMAQSQADARPDLYRVRSVSGHDAEVELVRGGGVLGVKLTGPFLRTGDFALMRVHRFDDQLFVADSPYLLQASEEAWREHLDRVVVRQQGPASASAPQKAGKLSSKEQARRRQKDKAKASRNEPEEIIRRYLKFGPTERYWFDYVMDAYVGERRGIVVLAGVPDRPELLPHSSEYQGAAPPELHPMGELRAALLQIAKQEGLADLTLRELSRLREPMGAEAAELSPNEQNLLTAYATLGLRAQDGTTALIRFEGSRAAKALRPEARAALESIKNGGFAVLRVERIHLDEGLEVLDLLRGQRQRVSERSATRQLALGDLVLGWLCKDSAGILTLEGGIAHVPSLAAEPIQSLVEDLRRAVPKVRDEQAWNRDAADMVLPLIAGILQLRENPLLPKLMKSESPELSPELAAELHRVVLAKIRSTLDEPIPQFKGKTLRQLARNAKSRPDAVSWLREQERLFQGNPQLSALDLRPVWEELALPFQGLETDPSQPL
jgi:hypothetical protein